MYLVCAIDNRAFEITEIRVVFGVKSLLLNELLEYLNQIEFRRVGGQEQ